MPMPGHHNALNATAALAVAHDGAEITTADGLAPAGDLHPVHRAFLDRDAFQCGYCTPGMIMQSVALLEENPDPTEEEIRLGLEGNLCRCTGYQNIVKSVLRAAEITAEIESGERA